MSTKFYFRDFEKETELVNTIYWYNRWYCTIYNWNRKWYESLETIIFDMIDINYAPSRWIDYSPSISCVGRIIENIYFACSNKNEENDDKCDNEKEK